MKQFKILCFLSLLISLFWGCAAALVPYTSDPYKKISNALALLDLQRPLPAERFIFEAMDTFQEAKDKEGMAAAHHAYGVFLNSPEVGGMEKRYREKGFLDSSVNFDNRFKKSIEYLEKARAVYVQQNKWDMLSNTYFQEGVSFMAVGDNDNACRAFQEAIISNKKNSEVDPTAKIILPKGYASFENYIQRWQKKANCK